MQLLWGIELLRKDDEARRAALVATKVAAEAAALAVAAANFVESIINGAAERRREEDLRRILRKQQTRYKKRKLQKVALSPLHRPQPLTTSQSAPAALAMADVVLNKLSGASLVQTRRKDVNDEAAHKARVRARMIAARAAKAAENAWCKASACLADPVTIEVLKIRLVKLSNLVRFDNMSYSDPYAVVWWGDTKLGTTQVVENCHEPEFEEECFLICLPDRGDEDGLRKFAKEHLRVTVYDYDTPIKSDLHGHALVQGEQILRLPCDGAGACVTRDVHLLDKKYQPFQSGAAKRQFVTVEFERMSIGPLYDIPLPPSETKSNNSGEAGVGVLSSPTLLPQLLELLVGVRLRECKMQILSACDLADVSAITNKTQAAYSRREAHECDCNPTASLLLNGLEIGRTRTHTQTGTPVWGDTYQLFLPPHTSDPRLSEPVKRLWRMSNAGKFGSPSNRNKGKKGGGSSGRRSSIMEGLWGAEVAKSFIKNCDPNHAGGTSVGPDFELSVEVHSESSIADVGEDSQGVGEDSMDGQGQNKKEAMKFLGRVVLGRQARLLDSAGGQEKWRRRFEMLSPAAAAAAAAATAATAPTKGIQFSDSPSGTPRASEVEEPEDGEWLQGQATGPLPSARTNTSPRRNSNTPRRKKSRRKRMAGGGSPMRGRERRFSLPPNLPHANVLSFPLQPRMSGGVQATIGERMKSGRMFELRIVCAEDLKDPLPSPMKKKLQRVWREGDHVEIVKTGTQIGKTGVVSDPDWTGRVKILMDDGQGCDGATKSYLKQGELVQYQDPDQVLGTNAYVRVLWDGAVVTQTQYVAGTQQPVFKAQLAAQVLLPAPTEAELVEEAIAGEGGGVTERKLVLEVWHEYKADEDTSEKREDEFMGRVELSKAEIAEHLEMAEKMDGAADATGAVNSFFLGKDVRRRKSFNARVGGTLMLQMVPKELPTLLAKRMVQKMLDRAHNLRNRYVQGSIKLRTELTTRLYDARTPHSELQQPQDGIEG
jgi:hypothetical protein